MGGYPPCPNGKIGNTLVAGKRDFRTCRSNTRNEDGNIMWKRMRRLCLGVGITKLDGDIPDELVLKSDGHDTRDCLHDSRFSVCDVSDCPYSTR